MAEEKIKKIAIVRVRGIIGIKGDIKATLNQLKIYRKNYCTVVPNNESYKGMIQKVKDYVTWGELDDETFKLLVEKKGEDYKGRLADRKDKISYKNRYMEVGKRKIKKFFRLNAPKKGYGKEGIKQPASLGGALGYRKDKINDLIQRMI